MPESRSACPVCGSTHFDADARSQGVLDLAAPFGVAQCSRCGMRWLDPSPTPEEYDRLYDAVYFDDAVEPGSIEPWMRDYPRPPESARRYSDESRSLREAHNATMLSRLGAPRASANRLLEVGCGHGEFLTAARSAGWDVQGVEPSAKAAQSAIESGLNVFHGNLESFSSDTAFDAIYLSHVFEHLPDPTGALQSLLGMLGEGGQLLVVVPNQFEAWIKRISNEVRRRRTTSSRTLFSIHHPMFYGPAQLQALLEAHGLEVELFTHQPHDFDGGATRRIIGLLDRAADALAKQGSNIEALARRR